MWGGIRNTYEKHWKYLVFWWSRIQQKQTESDGIIQGIDILSCKYMERGGNVGGFENTYEKHWEYLVFWRGGIGVK